MDSIKRYLHFVKPYRLQIIMTVINRDYQICHSFTDSFVDKICFR